MEKCDCYHEEYEIIGWLGPDEQIRKLRKRCNGTKERDLCSCGGDRTKCDFYPEVRKKAKEKVCKDCTHFIGAGDWNLCCTQHHEGYPFGFLCYEDTPACDQFSPKIKTLNLDTLKDRMIQGPSTEEALKDIEPFDAHNKKIINITTQNDWR